MVNKSKKKEKKKKPLLTKRHYTLSRLKRMFHHHPHTLLHPPHLQYLPVRIRMQLARESRAARRPILRHKPPGLVPYTTSIAECLRPIRPRSPLRGLVSPAMLALPPNCRRHHRRRPRGIAIATLLVVVGINVSLAQT